MRVPLKSLSGAWRVLQRVYIVAQEQPKLNRVCFFFQFISHCVYRIVQFALSSLYKC